MSKVCQVTGKKPVTGNEIPVTGLTGQATFCYPPKQAQAAAANSLAKQNGHGVKNAPVAVSNIIS